MFKMLNTVDGFKIINSLEIIEQLTIFFSFDR